MRPLRSDQDFGGTLFSRLPTGARAGKTVAVEEPVLGGQQEADLKPVDEGYHIAIARDDVAGHPNGNANIDVAYNC